jgi:hypothetical protein
MSCTLCVMAHRIDLFYAVIGRMSVPSRVYADLLAQAQAAAASTFRAGQPCVTPDCVATRAKAGSMGFLGRLFGPTAYKIYYDSTGNTFRMLFYISVVFFIIFLVLIFVHFTMYPMFSFSPNEPGILSIPTISDKQMTYTKSPATYDLSANFVKLPPCTYTLASDIYLSGTFMLAQVPRVILYRSANPVNVNETLSGITDSTTDDERLGITNRYLKQYYPDTNIIVWLDPVKNDLYVSVATINPSGGSGSKIIETTNPIENVPIKRVFRLVIVFTPNFLEVYVNGRLEESMAIKNPLVSISSTSYIYPTINPIQQNVMIGNMSMWPRVLTAREIGASEAKPSKDGAFFFENT